MKPDQLLQDINKYPFLFEPLILIYLVLTRVRKGSIIQLSSYKLIEYKKFLCEYITSLGLFIIYTDTDLKEVVFVPALPERLKILKNCSEEYNYFLVLKETDIYDFLTSQEEYDIKIGNILGYFCAGQEGWDDTKKDRYVLRIEFYYKDIRGYINEVCTENTDLEKLISFGYRKVDNFKKVLPPEIKVDMKIEKMKGRT